jgi:hypothetical protein
MRLYRYMTESSDDDASAFRSMNIDLVEEDTGNIDLVKKITEIYLLDEMAIELLEKANRELKKMYRGKMKFDYCMEEQGFTPEQIRIEPKKVRQLKEKWFKFNNELSELQIDFERLYKKDV